MLELDFPWMFALLPAPLLAWWLLPAYRERRQSVRVPFFEKVAAATGAEPARGGVQRRRNVLQGLIATLAWALIVTALARPQLVEPPIEKIESARDLMLAVDLSGSMDTPDMLDPEGHRIQRLDAVKLVLDDFIARREGDRLGVVVFGNQAFLQAPFTQDHDLVRTLLEQTRPRLAGPQTMIGDAIGLTIKTFENSEAKDRVLVLLTDGNDSGSKVPPNKAAEIAAQNGITIHTVAVGDPSSTGESEMDLDTLQAVADATGGQAFRADDRAQLEEIYRQIDALAPVDVETFSYRPTRPLYHWPLAAAVLLTLLYHLLMGTRQALRSLGARHA
ncbi:MAG: VWA domain-containing protein [Thermoanaerobaculia bacterium]